MKKLAIVEIKMVCDKTVTLDIDGSNAGSVASFIRDFIGPTDREHLVMVALNTRGRVVAVNEISVGSVSASIAHPREIFKPAILANASAFIIAHNHPSNEIDPSDDDLRLTKRIKEASRIMGIEMLDHFVIGEDKFFSIEKGISVNYPAKEVA